MNSMQYATWMNTAQQNTVGRDYFDAEWMQHIEAYYKDPANNSPVFIHQIRVSVKTAPNTRMPVTPTG